MSEQFDLHALGKDPMVDGPEAVALANALAAAKPANAPPNVVTLAGKMVSASEAVAVAQQAELTAPIAGITADGHGDSLGHRRSLLAL